MTPPGIMQTCSEESIDRYPPPRAVYVHVPFCRDRCPYCSFTVSCRDELIDDYLRAVEIELSRIEPPKEKIDTLFFGGGTPTHLDEASLRRLFRAVTDRFSPADDCEWSVEANPNDLTMEKVELLSAAGVNRVSIGAQSYRPEKLAVLGRRHEPDDIHRAIKHAASRFASLAMDMIFAVPGETPADWQTDLQQAVRSGVDHLSTYGLTFERGAAFWNRLRRGEIRPVDEADQRAMYDWTIDFLEAAGWEHYEISNFARPGHACRHNDIYWSGGRYFGIGPGASRFVGNRRETNHRGTAEYIRRVLAGRDPTVESETLDDEQLARERLVFSLRKRRGFDRGEFRRATGFSVEQLIGPALEKYVRWGMIQLDGDRIRLTRKGLPISDAIWPDFL